MTDAGQIVRDVISKAPDDQVMRDLDSAAVWAGHNGGDVDRLGITGFCRGGRAVWLYDAHSTKLKAAVAWYGPLGGQTSSIQPKTALEVAGEIHAPLLGLYGKNDPSSPESALMKAENKAKAAGRTAQIIVYTGAGHGFAADYRPSYDEAAAMDGWQRMLAWFKQYGVV
jgi:carboxymethylenebutenolidase